MDDDDGVGDAPRFVDGFLGLGVQSVEGLKRPRRPSSTWADLNGSRTLTVCPSPLQWANHRPGARP